MSTINHIVVDTVKAYHRELDSIIDAMMDNETGYVIECKDSNYTGLRIRNMAFNYMDDYVEDMNNMAVDGERWGRFTYTVYGRLNEDKDRYEFLQWHDTYQYYEDMNSYFDLEDLNPLFERLVNDRLYDLSEGTVEYHRKNDTVTIDVDIVYSYRVENEYSDSVPTNRLVIDPYNVQLYMTTAGGLVHYYDRESAEDTAQKDNLLVVT